MLTKLKKLLFAFIIFYILQIINYPIYADIENTENIEIGEIAKVTALEKLSIITGTPYFNNITTTDSVSKDGQVRWLAGSDGSSDDRIVRSYDKITYNLLVRIGIKDQYSEIKSIDGGRLCFECIIPENQLEYTYWSMPNPNWTTVISRNIKVDDKKYRYITGYWDFINIIPGQISISFDLMTCGAENGSQVSPEFKVWLDKNTESEKMSYIPETIYISSKPSYNIGFNKNEVITEWSYEDLDGNGTSETLGKKYTVPIYLDCTRTTASQTQISLKGMQNPTSDFNFNIELELKKIIANNGQQVNMNNELKPIFINFESTSARDEIDKWWYSKLRVGELSIQKTNNARKIKSNCLRI